MFLQNPYSPENFSIGIWEAKASSLNSCRRQYRNEKNTKAKSLIGSPVKPVYIDSATWVSVSLCTFEHVDLQTPHWALLNCKDKFSLWLFPRHLKCVRSAGMLTHELWSFLIGIFRRLFFPAFHQKLLGAYAAQVAEWLRVGFGAAAILSLNN